MLTVAKVTGTHAIGYAEYLEGKSTATSAGDYYLKDGERVEAPGRWIAGAQAIGCAPAARVTGEQLRTLMDVRRPDTGATLRPAGSTGEAVSALDATFSAPKSVSAVWALAEPELRAAVEQAHETAIDRALRYATAQMAMIRERIDRRTVIHTKPRELIATAWRHTTARAVDGPPDPQLHTHVLVHAAVRRDGQIVAVDSRTWLTHRRELGAAYRTELAHELMTLGFGIRRGTGRGSRYFEMDGIPQALLDRWSSRHHQVQGAIRGRLESKRAELQSIIDTGGPAAEEARERLRELESNGLGAAEDRFLAQATRTAKQPITSTDLDAAWIRAAAEHGLHPAQLGALRRVDRETAAQDLEVLQAQLTEHDAMLTRSHARAIALEHGAGVPIRDALVQLAQLRDADRLLTLTDGTVTTDVHRRREHATVELAQALAAADVDPLPDTLIARHTTRLDSELRARGGALSDEQRAALAIGCGEHQLVVIEGQAGTGKSTVLIGIARAHEDAGQQIIVTSTAALAAQRLADELATAGTHPTAHSTVALTHAINTERLVLDPAATIIHDEAALASTRELEQLLGAVEDSGARLILVGDPRQSQPVGAGGLWPHIHQAAAIHDGHAPLTHNLRAHDPADARDQARFRAGDPVAALESYQARGRLHLHEAQQAAEDAALDAAHADRTAGQRALVITQTSNDHLDQLNARAQAIRHQHGELGDTSLPLAGRPYRLHPGDEIQLRASLHHLELGTLRNGTTATIAELDEDQQTATLRLVDERRVVLSREQLDHAQARLAYVQHPVPAQGTTSDTTHVIVGEHPTQEGTYVALTRARHATHLYAGREQLDPDTDPVPQLAERLSRSEPELPSISLPLAHEHRIREEADQASARHAGRARTREPTSDHAAQDDRASYIPAAIRAYRTRYDIPADDERPLGPLPPAGAFQQRLDRRHAADDALGQLANDHSTPARTLRNQLRDLDRPGMEREASTL